MITFEQMEKQIVAWAGERGLLEKSNIQRQFFKTIEELGELAKGILKNDPYLIQDGYGDIIVTLIIGYQLFNPNISIVSAIESAYDVIKDRQCKTINGVFVKD